MLKPAVEEAAREAWEDFQVAEDLSSYRGASRLSFFQVAGEVVHPVERVLDVRQGELCWVVGTIYMDMPLKPNILEDISKDVRYSHAATRLT